MNRPGRSNERRSIFNDPKYGPRDGRMDNMRYNMQNQFSSLNSFSSSDSLRTPQQIAFEIEFNKWETGFEEWKRSWANHPDKMAYKQYEQKFMEVRVIFLN